MIRSFTTKTVFIFAKVKFISKNIENILSDLVLCKLTLTFWMQFHSPSVRVEVWERTEEIVRWNVAEVFEGRKIINRCYDIKKTTWIKETMINLIAVYLSTWSNKMGTTFNKHLSVAARVMVQHHQYFCYFNQKTFVKNFTKKLLHKKFYKKLKNFFPISFFELAFLAHILFKWHFCFLRGNMWYYF